MAVDDPVIVKIVHPEGDCFATVEHTFCGQSAVLTYWHRSLHAMTDASTAAGVRTAVISEPHPGTGRP